MSVSRDKTAPETARQDQANPKAPTDAQSPADNRIKDPQDWVTGEEPMTGAQQSYLKTLSEQAHEPEAFDPSLDKAEASERIDELKRKRDGQS